MAWKYNPFTNSLNYYEKPSNPPPEDYKIVNWYVDSATGKLVIEYDDKD